MPLPLALALAWAFLALALWEMFFPGVHGGVTPNGRVLVRLAPAVPHAPPEVRDAAAAPDRGSIAVRLRRAGLALIARVGALWVALGVRALRVRALRVRGLALRMGLWVGLWVDVVGAVGGVLRLL